MDNTVRPRKPTISPANVLPSAVDDSATLAHRTVRTFGFDQVADGLGHAAHPAQRREFIEPLEIWLEQFARRHQSAPGRCASKSRNPCSISFSCVSRPISVVPSSVSRTQRPGYLRVANQFRRREILVGLREIFAPSSNVGGMRAQTGVRVGANFFQRYAQNPVSSKGSTCASRCRILRAMASVSRTTCSSTR